MTKEGVDTVLLRGTVGGAVVAVTDHQRLEVGAAPQGESMVEVGQGAVHLEVVTASPIITAAVIKKVADHGERKILAVEEA